MTQNLVPPIIAVLLPATERTLPEATTAKDKSGKKKMKKDIRKAPIYWPLKSAPQDSAETPNKDSQTTHQVGPIPPNLPSPALSFSLRKP